MLRASALLPAGVCVSYTLGAAGVGAAAAGGHPQPMQQ